MLDIIYAPSDYAGRVFHESTNTQDGRSSVRV